MEKGPAETDDCVELCVCDAEGGCVCVCVYVFACMVYCASKITRD